MTNLLSHACKALFRSTGVSRSVWAASAGAVLVFTPACDSDALSGDVWNVRLRTERNECTSEASYDEVVEFVVDFQGGSAVTVGTKGAVFATGEIAGCVLTYQTGVWEEDRGNGLVRWELVGEAFYRLGGTACELPDGLDWQGSETFTILSSEDAAVPTGCQSVLVAEGTYVGER